VEDGYRVILGNRKHVDSVLVKQEERWGIGIRLLRHMQRMIGQPIFSLGIHDTQAAFKLYESSVVERIIPDPTTYDFSFDTDWILAVIAMNEPFVEVPCALIESARARIHLFVSCKSGSTGHEHFRRQNDLSQYAIRIKKRKLKDG
jgi:hypothetical protein